MASDAKDDVESERDGHLSAGCLEVRVGDQHGSSWRHVASAPCGYDAMS